MTTLIAIDWGSSNRRTCVLDHARENGGDTWTVRERHHDAQGVLTVGGDFGASLASLLQRWPDLPTDTPVIMSGMIGSRSGWREAPYVPCPAPLGELGRHLIDIAPDPRLGTRRISIVPGVCQHAGADVMRGEEIQILGALLQGGGDGLYVLPGTHSKWARVENGRIAAFRSFMTGELFALLGQHSSLSAMLGNTSADEAADLAAFSDGVTAASARTALSHEIFALRAAVLLGQRDAGNAKHWLSGLLIGAEWHDPQVRAWAQAGSHPVEVRIVGEAGLATSYARVAAHLGITHRLFEPEPAFIAAVQHLWKTCS